MRQLLVRLAVRPARTPRDVGELGKAGLHLVHRESLPVADVDLAQRLELLRVQPESVGDDPGRLARSAERARVDGGQSFVAERVRELARLPSPGVVQRHVCVALKAALAVPVGLAVSDEDERRRHAG